MAQGGVLIQSHCHGAKGKQQLSILPSGFTAAMKEFYENTDGTLFEVSYGVVQKQLIQRNPQTNPTASCILYLRARFLFRCEMFGPNYEYNSKGQLCEACPVCLRYHGELSEPYSVGHRAIIGGQLYTLHSRRSHGTYRVSSFGGRWLHIVSRF